MKKFFKKVAGFSLGPIASAFFGIILIPIITRFISPAEYGRASMFTVTQGLLTAIVYLGMDQAYAREFASAKDEKRNELLLNACFPSFVLSLVIGTVLIAANSPVSYLLFGSKNETLAVCLMAAMFPFIVIQHFSLTQLRFEGKGFQFSFFNILLKLFTLIISVAFLLGFERSFRSVVYAAALSEILNGIILYFVVFSKKHLSLKMLSSSKIKTLLRFALPLIPATMISWVLTSTDKFMLRSMCTYEELGLYSAASKIVSVLGIFQSVVTTIWVPIAFQWHESGKDKKYFTLTMRLVSALMVGVCIMILICKTVVGWVLGDAFVQAISVFPFLMLYPIMYTMSEITTVGIPFARKTEYNILISAISGGANILLNYLLIPVLGGVGAAIATGSSYILFFWLRSLISRKLWFSFPIANLIVYTAIIILNCAIHTFMNGAVPYIVSLISIVVVAIGALPQVKEALALLKSKPNDDEVT